MATDSLERVTSHVHRWHIALGLRVNVTWPKATEISYSSLQPFLPPWAQGLPSCFLVSKLPYARHHYILPLLSPTFLSPSHAPALLLNKETNQGPQVKFQESVNLINPIDALIETTLNFHTKT